MLIITTPIRLYGRNVITDLALRSGSVDANSFSATSGLSAMVDSLWSEPTFASKEALFQQQIDFDADSRQPHFKEFDRDKENEEYERERAYDPSVDKTDFSNYYRRLEDIDSGYLEEYVGFIVYSICRYAKNGVKMFNYKHAVAPTLMDLEDDSVTELADLETDGVKDAWSEATINEALTKLPYVLKRLHNLSRYTGIHMLSFVCSYMIAKDKNIRAQQAGSSKYLKHNAVIAENVWTCDNMGDAVHKVVISNKNLKAKEMFAWIEGEVDKYHAYHEDVTNFMHYVKVLNININENMEKYGTAFINKLVVTTLTPNSQYNQSIYNALLSGGVARDDSFDALQATMCKFKETCMSDESLMKVVQNFDMDKQTNNLKTSIKLYTAYCLMNGKLCSEKMFEFHDGYLYYDGDLCVMDSHLFTNMTFFDSRCVISELGFLVQVGNELVLNLMTVYCAEENMQMKIHKDSDNKLNTWWRVSL